MAEDQASKLSVALEQDRDGNFCVKFTPNPLPVCKEFDAQRVVHITRTDTFNTKQLFVTAADTASRNGFSPPLRKRIGPLVADQPATTCIVRGELGLDKRPEGCFPANKAPDYDKYTYKISLHAENENGIDYAKCKDPDHGDIEVEC